MDKGKWHAAIAAAIAAGGDSSDPAFAVALLTRNPAGFLSEHGTEHPKGLEPGEVVTYERTWRAAVAAAIAAGGDSSDPAFAVALLTGSPNRVP